MTTPSIHRVLDLLERVDSVSCHREVLTTAGILVDLVSWAYVWGHEKGCKASFLDWLRKEAQKYEVSVDEDIDDPWHGIAPEHYERGWK